MTPFEVILQFSDSLMTCLIMILIYIHTLNSLHIVEHNPLFCSPHLYVDLRSNLR
jgi:hypothetical protein